MSLITKVYDNKEDKVEEMCPITHDITADMLWIENQLEGQPVCIMQPPYMNRDLNGCNQ